MSEGPPPSLINRILGTLPFVCAILLIGLVVSLSCFYKITPEGKTIYCYLGKKTSLAEEILENLNKMH